MGVRSWLKGTRAKNQAAVFMPFTSANGLYSFEYPRSWSVSTDGGVLVLESGSQAIHVSASNGAFPETLPQELLEKSFITESPVTAVAFVGGVGWQGIHRQYRDNTANPPRHWLAVVAHNHHGYVLVTWNAQGAAVPNQLVFEHIVKTLRLGRQ